MATTQGGNPLARHIDDALKREDHATPATNPPKDEQNPGRGRGGEVDDDGPQQDEDTQDGAADDTLPDRQPRGDEPIKP